MYKTGRIEELVHKLESSGDAALVATARELVESLMELHGTGLERMLEIVSRGGEAGREILQGFGRDDLVGNLLVLYGLHPLDLETRIRSGLEQFQARTRSSGGEVELLSIQDGVVRLRVQPSARGCGSSNGSLKVAVEDVIYAAAPDVAQIVIEGGESPSFGFIPLEKLTAPAKDAGV